MRPSSTVESVPWITAEGTLDLAKFPIDAIVRQTLAPDFERFRSGCALLGSMAGGGRLEAGVYLVGLLPYHASDLQRLDVIAEQLQHFIHESSAHALFAEIRRSEAAHAALLFAYVAWNRAAVFGARGPDYRPMLLEFEASSPRLWDELKSSDAEALVKELAAYKQAHHPNDHRHVVVCGMRGDNVHVEWIEPPTN